MLVYYFVPFFVSNRYLLFWVSKGHNSVTVQNRTHVYMNFFDHKDLGNHLLQLCPKVVKHPVYIHFLDNSLHFSATFYFLVLKILLWDDSVFLGCNAASLGNRLPADVAPFPWRTVLSATMLRKLRISYSSVAIRILCRRTLISRNVEAKGSLFRELPPTSLQPERFFREEFTTVTPINKFAN